MRAPAPSRRACTLLGDPLIDLRRGAEAPRHLCRRVPTQRPALGQGDLTLGIRYLDEAVLHEGLGSFVRRDSRPSGCAERLRTGWTLGS